jgi:8-oxo-dGTP pyrophosphatase MutT (NUDIX family)
VTDLPIRPAATVVLLRDGADGLEVWLQQRATTLAFAAGMYAFPGGSVDAAEDTSGCDAERLVSQGGIWGDEDVEVTAQHVAAAVRETWEESGVRVDVNALVPWARWVTPPGESRRFDARFFLAACPADQEPEALTSEVAAGSWFVIRVAVESFAAGALPMWPPTISTLASLAAYEDVASALGAGPTHIEAVRG